MSVRVANEERVYVFMYVTALFRVKRYVAYSMRPIALSLSAIGLFE